MSALHWNDGRNGKKGSRREVGSGAIAICGVHGTSIAPSQPHGVG